MKQIAIYGKGGIGKSTMAANLSAAMAFLGKKVLQIGCDPKHDSTRLLLGRNHPVTILEILKERTLSSIRLEEFLLRSSCGVDCIEAGGPEPGVGCAGRGIISMAEVLASSGLKKEIYDCILYDVLGDVVCGGFAVPMRDGFAEEIYIVTSGEIMSLYAANNIARGLKNLANGKLAGIIGNSRGSEREKELIAHFARVIGSEMIAFFERDPIFKEAESAKKTVLSYAPESNLTQKFIELAKIIVKSNSHKKVKPVPLSEPEFEEMLSHFFEKSSTSFRTEKRKEILTGSNSQKERTGAKNWERYFQPKNSRKDETLLQSQAVAKNEVLYSCALAGAFSISNQIQDAVTVMHAPTGCAHTSLAGANLNALSQMRAGKADSVPSSLFCTNMREKEMIFGGEELLEKTLTDLIEQNPSAIFVISSCPSAIIGDDPKKVIVKLKNKENGKTVPILHLDTDGIFEGDYAQGILNAYRNITENFVESHLQAEKGLLNLVAEPAVSGTSSHFAFFQEFLYELDLKLNCRYIHHTTLSELKKFKRAELNILACRDSVAQAIASYLEKKLDAKFFPEPLPVGWKMSCEWTKNLCKELYGTTQLAEKWIEKKHSQYHPRLTKIKNKLAGKRALLLLYQSSWEWLWELLSSLEVEILNSSFYFSAFEGSGKTEESAQDLLWVQKPDIVISNYALRNLPEETMAGIVPLYPPPGFLGALEVAERWCSSCSTNFQEGWRNDLAL